MKKNENEKEEKKRKKSNQMSKKNGTRFCRYLNNPRYETNTKFKQKKENVANDGLLLELLHSECTMYVRACARLFMISRVVIR